MRRRRRGDCKLLFAGTVDKINHAAREIRILINNPKKIILTFESGVVEWPKWCLSWYFVVRMLKRTGAGQNWWVLSTLVTNSILFC